MLIGQVIIEPLHVDGGQLREPQRADGGLDVLLDVCLVAFDCARLYAVQVFFCPCVEPLADCHFRRLKIISVIDSDRGGLHFLAHLFLSFSREAAPYLLARAGIPANSDTCFPKGIFFSVSQYSLLADIARALSGAAVFLSRHCIFLLYHAKI